MESRYALREIECAIGRADVSAYGSRRMVFRHTPIHNRLRRDFMERKDAIVVLQASMISMACLGSNPRVDPSYASKLVLEKKNLLSNVVFPYFKIEEQSTTSASSEQDLDAYFDELDDIVKRKEAAEANTESLNSEDGEKRSHIGVQDSK